MAVKSSLTFGRSQQSNKASRNAKSSRKTNNNNLQVFFLFGAVRCGGVAYRRQNPYYFTTYFFIYRSRHVPLIPKAAFDRLLPSIHRPKYVARHVMSKYFPDIPYFPIICTDKYIHDIYMYTAAVIVYVNQ